MPGGDIVAGCPQLRRFLRILPGLLLAIGLPALEGVPGIGLPAAVAPLAVAVAAGAASALTVARLAVLPAEAVGIAAFDGVIGGVDLFHFFHGLLVAGVHVGMILFCQLAVSLFDLFVGGIAADAQHFIGISHWGASPFLFSFCSCRGRAS